jgi:excisionase family DNA binding protein
MTKLNNDKCLLELVMIHERLMLLAETVKKLMAEIEGEEPNELPPPEKFLTDYEVAELVGRSRSTLQKDRHLGRSIPFIRIGKLIRYRQSDVDAWLAARPTLNAVKRHDRNHF